MTPRRCDALPSTDPVESMTEAAGCDLARWVDGLLPPHYIFDVLGICCQDGVSPSAAPLDVGRVVGSECKSGNVAGRCGRMLGCERVLFVDVGGVVRLPVLEDKSRTEKQDRCRQCSEDCGLVTPSRAAGQRHRGTCFAAVQLERPSETNGQSTQASPRSP